MRKDANYNDVKTAEPLLAGHASTLNILRSALSLPEVTWKQVYAEMFNRFAEMVQQVPMHVHDHSDNTETILDYTLEFTRSAASLGAGGASMLQQRGEDGTETQNKYAFAVISGALLIHTDRLLSGRQIWIPLSRTGEQPWYPWQGSLVQVGARGYRVQAGSTGFTYVEVVPLLLISAIVPRLGMKWLSADIKLYTQWVALLKGDTAGAGRLSALMQQVRTIKSESIGGKAAFDPVATGVIRSAPATSAVVIQDTVLDSIRELPGIVWRKGQDIWIAASPLLHLIVARLEQEHAMHQTEEQIIGMLNIIAFIRSHSAGPLWPIHLEDDDQTTTLNALCIDVTRLPEWAQRGVQYEGNIRLAANAEENHLFERPKVISPGRVKAAALNREDQDQAERFFRWISYGLENGTLSINQPDSPLHRVAEGLFLVTPNILKLYQPDAWKNLPFQIEKLRLHRTDRFGKSRITYLWTQHAPAQTLRGWLLPLPNAYSADMALPGVNNALMLVSELDSGLDQR